MKKIWIIGITLLTLIACKKEPAYEIRGMFSGAPEGIVVYLNNDSAKIVNGEFVFRGKADIPELTSIRVKGINKYGMPGYKGTYLWLENTDINVTCPWDTLPDFFTWSEQMKISGSLLNDQYQNYRKQVTGLGSRDSLWRIYQQVYLTPSFEWEGVDVSAGIEVMQKMIDLNNSKRQLAVDFIMQNPASPISVQLLTDQFHGQEYTIEEAEQMINSLDASLKNTPAYEELTKAFEAFCPTAKGQKYMDVPLRDKNGKEVKLSDYIQPDKYNMVEFWASWCSPCRAEIPHLRHVNKVCGDNFNLISISIDEKDADWQKAMKQENMTWTQLNDGKGFKGEATQKYGITGVPYSLILDGEGRIIAGELRGAELDILLVQLLGDKVNGL